MAVPDANTKSAKAYQLLKDKLQKGQFASGERLTEVGLAKVMNMSRAPIREAMLRLEAEGLLVGNGAYGGKYVAYIEDLDSEQVLRLYEMREVIEGLAARLAAKNLNGWQIDELRRLNEKIVERQKAGDLIGRMNAAVEFHQYLVGNCGNPLVVEVWENYHLMPLLQRTPKILELIYANVPEPERRKEQEEAWRPVVDAIASHDPDEADRRAREIIRRVTDAIRKTTWERL